jgi:hypothetical protein
MASGIGHLVRRLRVAGAQIGDTGNDQNKHKTEQDLTHQNRFPMRMPNVAVRMTTPIVRGLSVII